ncbi:arginase family protein [Sulfitobacter sp. PR48]|uniref:arginase family protein n=1 Tax=Sulfitobacter sp. PR48 TaxID=3028383 RepID=UPI00237BAE70|nr:arginase family protein [Sulfitobacter sp. PR48]MDD9720960.1 arginase family protein [Sulfitobacter sp. PR48]
MTANQTPVSLIGLPYHCGDRGRVPGNAMAVGPEVLMQDEHAPAALRAVFSDVDCHMIENAERANDAENGGDFRTIPVGDQMGRILVQNIRLAAVVSDAISQGRIPIVTAGTCSACFGMVGGVGVAEGPIGMIWFDAHADAETPDTSSNGFIEGMLTSTIAGHCWPRYRQRVPGFREIPEERIISVGIHEKYAEGGRTGGARAMGTIIDPPVIQKLGFEAALGHALDVLSTRCSQVYVHIDNDCMDPSVLRSSRHCADGGLTDGQVATGLDMIAKRFRILACCFTAFDPDVDPRGPSVIAPLMVKAAEAAARSISKIA